MRKQYSTRLFSLLILVVLITISGCSTAMSVVQGMRPTTPGLKKRVMVLPLIDQAGFGSRRAEQITRSFVEVLEESPFLLLYGPPEGESPPLENGSKELGIVYPMEVVEKAEKRGMNALLTVVLNPIETTTKETGTWPFYESSKVYEISVAVNVVDITSRSLLFTQLESAEVPVPLDEAQGKNEDEIIDEILMNTVTGMVKGQASAAVKRLVEQSWRGKILSVSHKAIKIDAGKNLGLFVGDTLEVFARRKVTSARSGQSVLMLDKKIGEIRLTLVKEKHALAVPVTEGPFSAGQVVRLRH